MAKEEKVKNEKVKNEKVLYFKLSTGRAFWKTPDGTIALNAFPDKSTGKAPMGGSISSKDKMNYARVLQAIDMGTLHQTGKKDIAPVRVSVREVTGTKEINAKIDMVAKSFVNLRQEQALLQVDSIDDPRVLTKIMELESKGQNTARRRRPEVLEALKSKLDALKVSSISEFVETGKDIPADFSPSQKAGKAEKTLEETFDK